MRDNAYDMVAFQQMMKFGRTSGVQLGDHGDVTICTASELHLSLPRTAPFLSADLSSADTNAQIKQAEGG
jgi:alpha-acetolactate decarboxylase